MILVQGRMGRRYTYRCRRSRNLSFSEPALVAMGCFLRVLIANGVEISGGSSCFTLLNDSFSSSNAGVSAVVSSFPGPSHWQVWNQGRLSQEIPFPTNITGCALVSNHEDKDGPQPGPLIVPISNFSAFPSGYSGTDLIRCRLSFLVLLDYPSLGFISSDRYRSEIQLVGQSRNSSENQTVLAKVRCCSAQNLNRLLPYNMSATTLAQPFQIKIIHADFYTKLLLDDMVLSCCFEPTPATITGLVTSSSAVTLPTSNSNASGSGTHSDNQTTSTASPVHSNPRAVSVQTVIVSVIGGLITLILLIPMATKAKQYWRGIHNNYQLSPTRDGDTVDGCYQQSRRQQSCHTLDGRICDTETALWASDSQYAHIGPPTLPQRQLTLVPNHHTAEATCPALGKISEHMEHSACLSSLSDPQDSRGPKRNDYMVDKSPPGQTSSFTKPGEASSEVPSVHSVAKTPKEGATPQARETSECLDGRYQSTPQLPNAHCSGGLLDESPYIYNNAGTPHPPYSSGCTADFSANIKQLYISPARNVETTWTVTPPQDLSGGYIKPSEIRQSTPAQHGATTWTVTPLQDQANGYLKPSEMRLLAGASPPLAAACPSPGVSCTASSGDMHVLRSKTNLSVSPLSEQQGMKPKKPTQTHANLSADGTQFYGKSAPSTKSRNPWGKQVQRDHALSQQWHDIALSDGEKENAYPLYEAV